MSRIDLEGMVEIMSKWLLLPCRSAAPVCNRSFHEQRCRGVPVMIGRTIGTYKITGTIGSSGMGEVFVGEDVMLGRQVAIKQLRPALASRPDVVERFHSEAVILAKLPHAHIATVYAFIQEDANFFLVMEYI